VPPGGRRPSLQGRIHSVSPQAYPGPLASTVTLLTKVLVTPKLNLLYSEPREKRLSSEACDCLVDVVLALLHRCDRRLRLLRNGFVGLQLTVRLYYVDFITKVQRVA